LVTTPHDLPVMIVDYSVGHTGSVHDSWAYRSTHIFKEHDCIFGPSELMWADSAYPSETWSVSPFKKPIGRDLSPDQTWKTFIFQKYVYFTAQLYLSCNYFRFAFVWSMLLDYLKADFNHCLNSGSKSTHTISIFGLSCRFDAA
jgi:DDE superfamily endonuclease